MKVYTHTVVEMTDTIGEYIPVESHYFHYSDTLPVAKCDRAAQAQAKNDVKTDNTMTGVNQVNAGTDRASLIPQLKNDVNNPTGYDANDQNKMLAAAEAGSGGATGSLEGAAGLEASRTRNSGSTPALLDSIARAKSMAAAKSSEGIAADSAKLGQAKRQSALGELGNLYGEDSGNAIKSADASNSAINTEITAGKSGWFQNMTDFMKAAGADAAGAGAMGVKV